MHTQMWLNPATRDNVTVLRERGLTVIDPDSGRLTGRDSGLGRLPEPEAGPEADSRVGPRLRGSRSGEERGREAEERAERERVLHGGPMVTARTVRRAIVDNRPT